nr:IucA/IucC family protein [uncultured Desulfobacter sp.]
MESSIPKFQYLERYRNKGTRTYSSHSEYTDAIVKYRPDSTQEKFSLCGYELPLEQLTIYTANPPDEIKRKYFQSGRALFCIHPQILEMAPDDPYVKHIASSHLGRKNITVVPSSSTRTLFVEGQKSPHALKVHFPFKISRYTRKMRDEVIEQAINVSIEMERGIHRMDKRFAFFREVIGVAHKNLDPGAVRCENWGYLVRDMTPFPYIDANPRRIMIPGFSLYGEDYFKANVPLLLFQLMQKQDPVQFVLKNIMLPIIRHWVDCFLNFGYILEPHGQNIVFELDEALTIRRIVHRDLSIGIDMRRRRDLQLSSTNLNHHNRMENFEFHSITYDRFMGGHFFDRIVLACQEHYPNLKKEQFTEPCKDEFVKIFPNHKKYLPDSIWYFSEERDEFNKPLYRNTKQKPEWRP